MALSDKRFLRAVLLPLFAKFNPGDIRIKHHFTGEKIRLHSYRHKGYWFHGKKRERETMRLFERILKKGDVVIEVGAHIGYVSLYFKQLVGEGNVIVFEPGENNLPYLVENTKARGVEVIKKAVGKDQGIVKFYLDSLSGQNNSLLKDFFVKQNTAANSFDPKSSGTTVTEVAMITLDSFVAERQLTPGFVKIDIEGFEFEALQGMQRTLTEIRPVLMVEIQTHQAEIARYFKDRDYILFDVNGRLYTGEKIENVFCFHRGNHKQLLTRLGWSNATTT